MAAQEIWKSDPLQGDFNPGSKLGKDIFEAKSKGLDEENRIPWSKANASRIHRYFRAREKNMRGCVDIPIEWNPDGTVKKTANLLSQYRLIKLQDCQRASHGRYNVPLAHNAAIPAAPFGAKTLDPANVDADKKQFYKKVSSNVVTKIVENGVTPSSFEDLMLKKDAFMFQNATTKEIELDGPTMLYIVLKKVDPETVVGLDTVEEKLQKMKLADYKNDVDAMLTEIETLHQVLKDNGAAPKESKYRKYILEALISGPNPKYNEFVSRVMDDVESGIGAMAHYSPDEIIAAARARYNNMEEKGLWDQVDPRDAQIMALVTEVQELKTAHNKAFATDGPSNRSGGNDDRNAFRDRRTDDTYISGLPRWRTKKTKGETTVVDGKTYWWCPHHVHPDGHWNGLYVQHPPERHRFKQPRKNGDKDEKDKGAPAANATTADSSLKLDLQSKLKEVLCTNLCLSDEDVDKLFEQASGN